MSLILPSTFLAAAFSPLQLWIEFWGPQDGIHREKVSINNKGEVLPEIKFTVEQASLITLVQIVNENNDPLVIMEPKDLSPNFDSTIFLEKGDSLTTKINFTFW